jgi:GTP cyclohydrolase IA
MLLFGIVPKECEPAPRPNSHRQADPIQAIIRFIFVYGAELSDDRDTRSEPLGIIMNIRPISLTSRPSVERMSSKPSQSDGEAAFRTVLHWIGEDPDRDGLRETPSRVARAFQEYFAGYGQDPEQVLRKTFEEIDGYDEMVVLRGIPFQSHCEHHMAPIVGQAWVAYVPDQRVVGVSKLARVVESYARRLQIQERLTAQIANTIEKVLQPKGVGVVVKAVHHCMSTRGINKQGTDLVTSRMLGCFRQDPMTRQEFLSMVH